VRCCVTDWVSRRSSDMTAGEAVPEVQSPTADPQAVLAAVDGGRQFADGNLVEVVQVTLLIALPQPWRYVRRGRGRTGRPSLLRQAASFCGASANSTSPSRPATGQPAKSVPPGTNENSRPSPSSQAAGPTTKSSTSSHSARTPTPITSPAPRQTSPRKPHPGPRPNSTRRHLLTKHVGGWSRR